MGEEISFSSRLWTSGYDIFSPTISVVGHIYYRRHKPKYWESVDRTFTPGTANPLGEIVANRIKHTLGYPKCDRDHIRLEGLLEAIDEYGMGTRRKLAEFLKIVGLDMTKREVVYQDL